MPLSQENIDIGAFPNDPSADAIRTAFQKTQNNFTELFNQTQSTGVIELIAGAGLDQNRTTGNIILTANIANITIQTDDSLVVGIGVATNLHEATLNYYNTPIVLKLANTISTVNANFTGNTTTSNLTVSNHVGSSLIPSGNVTFDLGSDALRWRDLYLSGSSIKLGSQTISSNSQGVLISNLFTSHVGSDFVPSLNEVYNLGSETLRWKDLFLSGNSLSLGAQLIEASEDGVIFSDIIVNNTINVGNVDAVYIGGTLTNNSQPNITSVGLLSNLSVASNIASGNISITGNLAAAQTITANTMTATTFTGNVEGNVILPPGAKLAAPGSDTQIMFNDGGNASAVPGLTFNKTTSLLSLTGNLEGGNLNTSGTLTVTQQANLHGGIITGGNVYANSGNVVAGNGSILGILTVSSNLSAGNLTTTGVLTVSGNTNIGNITAVDSITGNVMAISGNISGANLVASGLLRVDGNANVGNLTTSGLVSAATLAATTVNASSATITTGNLDITNGNLNGTNLIASGLLDLTGDLIAKANANITSLLSVFGTATFDTTLKANGAINLSNSAKIANLLSIGANLTITSATSSGGDSTLTFADQGFTPFQIGQTVFVNDIIPTGFRGTKVVTFANSTAIKFSGATAGPMTVAGTITTGGTLLSIAGNANVGNLELTGVLRAGDSNLANVNATTIILTGTANAGNFVSPSGWLNIGSNANVGSLGTTGLITADGNVTGANLNTAGRVVATGNVTGGNLTTSGLISATGNITSDGYMIASTFSGNFSGNGSGITYLSASVVTGTVGTASSAGTVSSSAQDSIVYANNLVKIGSLADLSVGNITGISGNLSTTGYVAQSVSAGVAAAGSTLAGATALSKQVNVITSATASTQEGVRLPGATAGIMITIINTTAVTVKVYPASGGYIDSLAVSTAFNLGPGAKLLIVAASTAQWYTLTGVYG